MNAEQNLSFLFGAGVSIPAGFPSTVAITERVLSGSGISRHTDSTYWTGTPMAGAPDEYVPKVISFLQALKSEIDHYYSYDSEKRTNYEDLCSLASQISDSESGNYDNPAVKPLIDKVRSTHAHVLSGRPYNSSGTWSLIDIASECVNYIRDVTRIELSKKPNNLACLNFLIEASRDTAFRRKNVFTLNHDVLFETGFLNNAIPFIDGFEFPNSGLRRWQPLLFDTSSPEIALLKLHCSINWFFFEEGDSYTLAVPLAEFWEKYPTERPVQGRPEILVGTLNKILEYSRPVFFDLQCVFSRLIADSGHLVVAGYSFGDKAINTRIIQWMDSASARRILIVHPNPLRLKHRARYAIRDSWDRWYEARRLEVIAKQIEQVSWNEIKTLLLHPPDKLD